MDVLVIGTIAGGIGMLLVFLIGYFLLKDRIAPVEVDDNTPNNPVDSNQQN